MTIKVLASRGTTTSDIARLLGVSGRNGPVSPGTDATRARWTGAHASRSGQKRWPRPSRLARCPGGRPDQSGGAARSGWLANTVMPAACARSSATGRADIQLPRMRARRRVEMPAGVQAQVDWAHFPGVMVGGSERELLALHMVLSWSRKAAIVWARERRTCWPGSAATQRASMRLGGVPATVRVDNEKTAVARGAGAWGTINPTYRRYAVVLQFHVDACQPRQPQRKGKVERRVRDQRLALDPTPAGLGGPGGAAGLDRSPAEELGGGADLPGDRDERRRGVGERGDAADPPARDPAGALRHRCRPGGRDRRAGAFEGRQYSVPFPLCRRAGRGPRLCRRDPGRQGLPVIASHPRGTAARLVIDPSPL